MVLQAASIIFNDSASQFNKDLTDFLLRHTETAIRKGQMTFNYKIAQSSDLADLRSQGIKRLPAMICDNKFFVGVPSIIEEIRRRVKQSKGEAAPKSEDEIVRDYQIKALGNISKDADGKYVINDEPDKDDKEELLSNFQKEIERRGTGAGYGGGGRGGRDGSTKHRITKDPPPRATARQREVDRDDDFENQAPLVTQKPAQRFAATAVIQRPDNLANPGMGDAMASLHRIGRTATGDDAQDDEMMARLLERMGDG